MAGRFLISNYQRDDDTNAPIKVQAETVTTWNTAGVGSRVGTFVKARGSRREYGVIARSITLSRRIGDGTDYNSATVSVRVPILTKAAFALLNDGDVIAYQGKTDWIVAGQSAESVK